MAKKKSATRRILKIVGLLILALLVLGVVGSVTGVFGAGEEGVAVETTEAQRREVTQLVTAFGRVQPEVDVQISPDVSGEIIELPIHEGEEVEKGELLAVIEADFYAAQLEQAKAAVKQAQANEAQRRADRLQAKAAYERKQKLYAQDAIPTSELEQAETAFKVAQASYEAARYQVEIAEARRREASEQLAQTRIYAPMSGTVSRLSVEVGERVVGTSQMAGTEMMRIALLDNMELEVDVNENDVVNVAPGDTATIEVDAYPERAFRGVVTEIANSARVEGQGTQQQVTNFPVKVRILRSFIEGSRTAPTAHGGAGVSREELPAAAPPMPTLRPGMSGTVEIYTQTEENVVTVPIQAVTVRDFNHVRPEGDSAATDAPAPAPGARSEDLRKVVFVIDSTGAAKMVEVETGISDDVFIVIQRGLEGGEEVIIGPYRAVSRELEPGMAVQVENGGPRLASTQ